jgi:hypothetical protein
MFASLDMARRIVASIFSIGAGIAMMVFGFSIQDIARPADWFAPMAFGGAAIAFGVIQLIRVSLKVRAPAAKSERAPRESETISFDADAAIARYLAEKTSAPEPFAVEPVPDPRRQVFGRKRTDTVRPVDPAQV